jgi:ABC-type oligopeptide transport system substrate-binding subunit/class 3 adenylate cyclase
VTTDGAAQPDSRATGFRTFLIADVRGYTAYTREHGDEAAAALAATFAATVREVVEARDGFLLELRGDEALVVFESPRQALRAAVALQERLQEVGLPRGVGIGLDAGEAVSVEGGYRGGALNLAARLCSQAKAGEILASEAVIHLAARIEGVAYVDPRMLRLKGYAEPIRAVEIVPANRVKRGLGPRVRRAQRTLRSHRRTALVIAVPVAAGLLAVAVATRPPLPTASADPLGQLPSGLAVLDATTGRIIAHVPTSTIKSPVDPLYAAGKFWVMNLEPFSVVEVDAKTGKIGRTIAPALPCCGGMAIDGQTMWVADFERPVIAKIHIPSGREVDRFDLSAQLHEEAPDGFSSVVVADGSLWLAGKDRGEVFRVNPANGKLEATISNVHGSWVLASSQGAIWAAAFGGLDRIDTVTDAVEHTDVSAGIGLGGAITTGAGFAWTANESKGVVYKVDLGGKLAATFATGLGARSVWFNDGVLWVGNQDEGTVSGIDVITGGIRTLTFRHPIGAVAAGSGSVAVVLNEGRSYEERIDGLEGKVARLFVEGYQVETGDPAVTWSPVGSMVEQATCATLVRYSNTDALEPEIAAGMPTVSEDGRTYTFVVRPGFAFSGASAEKVTAETFRFSIERALSPRLEEGAFAPGSLFLGDITGEKAFRDGKAAHISGLVAEGDSLTITLDAPSGDFLSRLTLPFFCPVPTGTPFLHGAVSERTSTSTGVVDTVPSAGPYYVADHLHGEYIILKRNPNYAGDRKAAFDAIALREGINGGVAVSRVQGGSWDGIVGVFDQVFDPAGELATRWGPASAAAAKGDQRYWAVPDGGVLGIVFNANRLPFSDRRLREAVSLVLDRKVLAGAFTSQFSAALPWNSLLGPSMSSAGSGGAPIAGPEVAKARQLAQPFSGSELKLVIGEDCEECARAAKVVVSELGAIGLRVQVEAVSDPVAAANIHGSPYDMLLGGIWPETPDPARFVAQVVGKDIPSGWAPSAIAGAAKKLGATSGKERAAAASALVTGQLAGEVPLAVFGYTVHGAFFVPSIGCLRFTPLGSLDLVALCPRR